jgi:putative membrane protein
VTDARAGARDDAGTLRSMANERTIMAWHRTALAWAAVGAVVIRYHAPDGLVSAATAVGAAMVVCAGLLALGGVVRYRQRDRALRTGGSVPEPLRWIRLVSVAVTVTMLGALIVELRHL